MHKKIIFSKVSAFQFTKLELNLPHKKLHLGSSKIGKAQFFQKLGQAQVTRTQLALLPTTGNNGIKWFHNCNVHNLKFKIKKTWSFSIWCTEIKYSMYYVQYFGRKFIVLYFKCTFHVKLLSNCQLSWHILFYK